MTKAYIVGGGLFGATIAHTLADAGYSVTVFDSNKKGSGSKPAACLMKPSWMTSIDYKPPMALLEKLFGVKTITFKVSLLKADCFWVDPKVVTDLSNFKVRNEEVISVEDGCVVTSERSYNGLVIVAAGVWSKELLPQIPEIRALCGSAIFGTGKVRPTIDPFAPYRQAVWFNLAENETWFGDGTAIIEKNFSQEHKDRTIKRAMDSAKISGRLVSGRRPYIKGMNGGLFEKLGQNLYVSTGGAKNGTILAAHNALKLMDNLK